MNVGVHLRDGHLKSCLPCADAADLGYTKAKKGAPCGYVVFDDWTDVKHVSQEYQQVKVGKLFASSKYKVNNNDARLDGLQAAIQAASADKDKLASGTKVVNIMAGTEALDSESG